MYKYIYNINIFLIYKHLRNKCITILYFYLSQHYNNIHYNICIYIYIYIIIFVERKACKIGEIRL